MNNFELWNGPQSVKEAQKNPWEYAKAVVNAQSSKNVGVKYF